MKYVIHSITLRSEDVNMAHKNAKMKQQKEDHVKVSGSIT
jgi:hypothetical protein